MDFTIQLERPFDDVRPIWNHYGWMGPRNYEAYTIDFSKDVNEEVELKEVNHGRREITLGFGRFNYTEEYNLDMRRAWEYLTQPHNRETANQNDD